METAEELLIRSGILDLTPMEIVTGAAVRDNVMHNVAVNGGGLGIEMFAVLGCVVSIFAFLVSSLSVGTIPAEPVYDVLVNWSSTSGSVSNDLAYLLGIVRGLPSWLSEALNPIIGNLFRDLHSPVTHTLKDLLKVFRPP